MKDNLNSLATLEIDVRNWVLSTYKDNREEIQKVVDTLAKLATRLQELLATGHQAKAARARTRMATLRGEMSARERVLKPYLTSRSPATLMRWLYSHEALVIPITQVKQQPPEQQENIGQPEQVSRKPWSVQVNWDIEDTQFNPGTLTVWSPRSQDGGVGGLVSPAPWGIRGPPHPGHHAQPELPGPGIQ